eukprot:121972_1
MPNNSFTYVLVPSDTSKPFEQVSLEYNKDNEISCMMDHLKLYFSNNQNNEVKKKNISEQFKDQKLEDPSIIDYFSSIVTVGQMPLQPTRGRRACESDHMAVWLYYDDNAVANGAEVNTRATELAALCGLPSPRIIGDVFIARTHDDDKEDFRRLDFALSECASDAEWVKAARERRADNKSTQGQTICTFLDCKSTKAQMFCGRCKSAFYCSRSCQKKDWRRHKPNCKKVEQKTEKDSASKKVSDSQSKADSKTIANDESKK